LAVAVDGEHPVVECCGLADLERRVPISAGTRFDLGSAAKIFTAATVLGLVEQERLSLEAEVGDWLEELNGPTQDRPIRVEDLLAHTSGLPDYLELGKYTEPEKATTAYIRAQLRTWSREARPGAAFHYCNTNFVVLAMLVERITGLTFPLAVQEIILDVVPLEQTVFRQHGAALENAAKGYFNNGYGLANFERSPPMALDTLGDGGLYSSLEDLLAFSCAFWGGEILNPLTLLKMVAPGRVADGKCFDYGLGCQVETQPNGMTWWGHGGSWTNGTVLIGRYPQQKMTLLLLSNDVLAPVERIYQRAMAHFRPPQNTKDGLAP